MESWAQRHGDVVRFLCVCVDALGVAKMFDRMFRFEHVLNAYIPSRDYFPEGYGQLGCSGFIVADENGNFISRKTKAYLDVGEEAFLDVERLLAKYIHKPSTSRDTFAAGAPVEQDTVALSWLHPREFIPSTANTRFVPLRSKPCVSVPASPTSRWYSRSSRHTLPTRKSC